MDPLSIASGVVGLVTAAAAVIKYLDSAKSNIQDAPRTITWAKAEVTDIRSAIVRLNDLFQDLKSVPNGARTAVGIQEAVVAVHELVFSFDRLSHILKPFNVEDPATLAKWDKVKWLRVQDDVVRYVLRLQTHKGSITLMLNILQCESGVVILESQRALEKKIDTLLDESETTQKRMARLEIQFYNFILSSPNSLSPDRVSLAPSMTRATGSDSMSVRAVTDRPQASAGNPAPRIEFPKAQTDASSSSITTTHITEPSLSDSPKTSEPATDGSSPPVIRLEFEETLQESNVYRRVHNPSDAFSMISADGRSVAGSVMTSYSLADDSSILSAFPIMNRSDLQHPEYYEDAAGAKRLSKGLLKAVVSRGVIGSGQKDPAAPFSLRNFRYPPELGLNCIGQWSQSKTRIFRRSELRFEVLFDVPIFFVSPPSNTRGPVRNASIYYLDGTPQSLESTWSDLNYNRYLSESMMAPKELARMGEGERATWLLLLSSLQRMESESSEWQRGEIQKVPQTTARLSSAEPPSLRDHHTLTAAIQHKRRSWDSLPLTFRRPYATTTLCHLVEIVAMLGIYWKEFNRTYHIYRAEGNGFLVTGYMVDGLGIMFSFQAAGRQEFGRNRIIPVDEIKDICFGYLPTIFLETMDMRRLGMPRSDLQEVTHLQLSTRKELAETVRSTGCNFNTVNYFLQNDTRTSHIFPIAFEIMGMIGRMCHIKNSCFRYLPNPTFYSWDSRSFFLPRLLVSYERFVRETMGPEHLYLNSLLQHVDRLLSEESGIQFQGPELAGHQEHGWLSLNALHEVIEDLDGNLTVTSSEPRPQARRLIKDVLAYHLQEVLYLMNESVPWSPEAEDGIYGFNRFENIDTAAPKDREALLMEIYFNEILPAVSMQVQKYRVASQEPATTGSDTTAKHSSLEPGNESAFPEFPDLTIKDIWCTLVLRMICWLMLHNFHPQDIQIPKSELRGSRLPAYIS